MRESVFAILATVQAFLPWIFFPGSGIIALRKPLPEAPIRWSGVERDRAKFPILLKKRIRCLPATHRMQGSAVELFLSRNREGFDLVFLDPPFPYAYRLDLLKLLSKKESLLAGGLLLIHFPREDRLPDRVDRLLLQDERRYGRSIVRFYRKDKA
jgi:16S rRNA G966 N2-methylase RsmD